MAPVTFRGFSPRTAMARWGLLAVAIGIVVGATAPRALQSATLELATRPENIPWHIERIVAFLAYFALAGSVVLGLLASTRILDAIAHRPVTITVHKELSAIGLGLAAIHGALLGLDHSMPFSVTQIAVPFASPYAALAVGAGQIALYLMLAVVGSFYLRTRIGPKAWRRLHYVSFLAFAGATIHGIAAGTDTSDPWAATIYATATTIVTFLLVFRIATAIGARVGDATTGARNRRLAGAQAVFGDPGAAGIGRSRGDRAPSVASQAPSSAVAARRRPSAGTFEPVAPSTALRGDGTGRRARGSVETAST